MIRKCTFYGFLTAAVVLSAFALQMAQAQPGGGGRGGRGGFGGPGGGGRGGFGGTVNREEWQKRMEQFRQQMAKRQSDALKKELGVTDDEEFKTLEALIKAVTDIQQEMQAPNAAGNRRGMWGRNTRNTRGTRGTRGARTGAKEGAAAGAKTETGAKSAEGEKKTAEKSAEEKKAEEEKSPMVKASEALRTTLANNEATAEQIAAALKTYRAEQAKMATKLAEARLALKAAVNPKQEAILVAKGILE